MRLFVNRGFMKKTYSRYVNKTFMKQRIYFGRLD